jgi:ferritin-like metal-binding protein YciE
VKSPIELTSRFRYIWSNEETSDPDLRRRARRLQEIPDFAGLKGGQAERRVKMANQMNSLHDLFVDELHDIYDAEQQLINALPKMAEAAHNQDLKRGFQDHLKVTRQQAQRIEQIFSQIGQRPNGKKCEGMQGILKEGEKIIKQMDSDPNVKDASLIAAAQKAEHYEIAGYGTLRTYAEQLGMGEAARMLDTSLEEESRTDEQLTNIAVDHINWEAMS